MKGAPTNAGCEVPDSSPEDSALGGPVEGCGAEGEDQVCFHCGEPCRGAAVRRGAKSFCCQGCLWVHDLLAENGLERFYELGRHPGVRASGSSASARWSYLDEPAVQQRLLDFTDGTTSQITFHVPAIHCVACVWLLENLFRLHPGIGRSRVDFPRREVALEFAPDKIKLSAVVALLASVGYEPALTLGALEKTIPSGLRKRQWLQIGISGFAFGNIMLFSLPGYFGLDPVSAPTFQALFGYLSLALALPVLVYSASDYWLSALVSLRRRVLSLDVPIALGLAALYGRSAYEIVSGQGAGYLDSLVGLVFFLLCGRAFQRKTYDRLAFDRDYRSFFPLSVTRLNAGGGRESVVLSDLKVGERIRLRNAELIPADARLVQGPACIDYSFVTGESAPVEKREGDYLYAGGRQIGGAIEVETVKPVSQSYLTSLWNHEAFQKDPGVNLSAMTDRFGRYFTLAVIAVAAAAALFWLGTGDWPRALQAFTSVLIVACPCALALAAPFTFGTAQRLLARAGVFLRNAFVIERLARVDAVVLDKTGTLTTGGPGTVRFSPVSTPGTSRGTPSSGTALTPAEESWIGSLAAHSTHPSSAQISDWLAGRVSAAPMRAFQEVPGEGLAGEACGHEIFLGSAAWLEKRGVKAPPVSGSAVHLAIDGRYRGVFVLGTVLRRETDRLLEELGRSYDLTLLSGDNESDRERFRRFFPGDAALRFNQSPFDKLGYVRRLQAGGRTVMMVGDGLNDAGALKQSDVGVAVVEAIGAFSPASDVILAGDQVPGLPAILRLARRATRVVWFSFGISAAYNLAGVSVAAAGFLSPLICAVLMPLSSISVVLFACGATARAARRAGLETAAAPQPDAAVARPTLHPAFQP